MNLQESPAGFGHNALEAMAELCKELGYKPSKMWGATFEGLLKNGGQMDLLGGMIVFWLSIIILTIAITVVILRWALRINTIVNLLKEIAKTPPKPKTFAEGFKQGIKGDNI